MKEFKILIIIKGDGTYAYRKKYRIGSDGKHSGI